MQVTISTWGNSQGIRIPKQMLDKLHTSVGAKVEVEYDAGKLTLTPLKEENTYDIYRVVKDCEHKSQKEVDWGKAEGREEW